MAPRTTMASRLLPDAPTEPPRAENNDHRNVNLNFGFSWGAWSKKAAEFTHTNTHTHKRRRTPARARTRAPAHVLDIDACDIHAHNVFRTSIKIHPPFWKIVLKHLKIYTYTHMRIYTSIRSYMHTSTHLYMYMYICTDIQHTARAHTDTITITTTTNTNFDANTNHVLEVAQTYTACTVTCTTELRKFNGHPGRSIIIFNTILYKTNT